MWVTQNLELDEKISHRHMFFFLYFYSISIMLGYPEALSLLV